MFRQQAGQLAVPSIKRFCPAAVLLLLFVIISGCAPTLYSVDLKYLSSDSAPPTTVGDRKFVVTVAGFNDARPGGEDLMIGRVINTLGDATSVLPKTMSPSAAVSTIVKDVLVKAGYQVSVAIPAWNLQENAIRKDWGKMLIGGNINELEIVCKNEIPIKTYEARVKLTVFVADVQAGKILRQILTSSQNSLEHIYFSEELLGQQISLAITEAVEKALEGSIFKEKNRDVTQ